MTDTPNEQLTLADGRTLAKMLTAPDQAMLAAEPALARNFGESLAEAYRQGIGGAMTEAALIARPRSYRLEDIAVPVHHGRLPAAHYLAYHHG